MDFRLIFNHHKWANQCYFDYIRTLSPEQVNQPLSGSNKSVRDLVIHLYNTYWFWNQFLTTRNYDDPPDFDELDMEQLIDGIKHEISKIEQYIKVNDITDPIEYRFDDNHQIVTTNAEQVITNHFLHAAYHRGQLALLLRAVGFKEIAETDFNPYIYELAQN